MSRQADKRPIIVAVDGSPSSIEALRKASELARALDAPLEAVTAWQFPMGFDGAGYATQTWSPEAESQTLLNSAVETAFPDGPPADLRLTVTAGPAAGVLIDKSNDAAMLVMGSRGRGGFAGLLLGSVSTACAQHAHCPVLIMRGPERPSKKTKKTKNRGAVEDLQPTV